MQKGKAKTLLLSFLLLEMVKTEHSNEELFRLEQINQIKSSKFQDFNSSVQDFK